MLINAFASYLRRGLLLRIVMCRVVVWLVFTPLASAGRQAVQYEKVSQGSADRVNASCPS